MNLHPKLYLALAALGIVLVTAAYYEWREPLPFDEKNPVSMKAPNIRAHITRALQCDLDGTADGEPFAAMIAALRAHPRTSQQSD